jgi:hypothetical protein
MHAPSKIAAAALGGILLSLQACSSAPPPEYACPGSIDGFLPNDATSAEVEHCLGKPDQEQKGEDGRYTWIYHLPHDVTASFLFSSAGRLINLSSPRQ